MATDSDGQPTRGATLPASKELSAVLGRILDQLSLSAWMPGVVLTGGVALLIAVSHSNPGESLPSVGEAITFLASPTVGGAIALVFGVVLATVMTQAFEFEMIKLLEGYWSDRPWSRWLRRRRVKALAKKGAKLAKVIKRTERNVRRSSLGKLAGGDKALKARLQVRAQRSGETGDLPPDPEADFLLARWRTAADPAGLRELEALERASQSFPKKHRTMPTMLGNTLRAREDCMRLADGGNLEGFVLRNYDDIPDRLIAQIGDFRTRLNMYCTLVLSWALLALFGAAATWRYPGFMHLTTVIVIGACLMLSWASYAAAISSAKGYGAALLAADEHIARLKGKGESNGEGSLDVSGTARDE